MNPFEQLLANLKVPKILGNLPQLQLNDFNNTGSATINPLAGNMNLSFGNCFGLDVNPGNKAIGIQTPVGALSGNFSKDNPEVNVAFPVGKTADVQAGYDRARGAFGELNFNIPFGGNQQSSGGRLPLPSLSSTPVPEVIRPPSTGRFLPGDTPYHLLPKSPSLGPDQEFLLEYINKRL